MSRVAGKRAEGEGAGGESRALPARPFRFARRASGGWTLIELVITLTVLSVLTTSITLLRAACFDPIEAAPAQG